MTRTPAPDPARRRRRAVPPCGVRGVAVHPSRQVVGQRRRLRGTLAAGLPVVRLRRARKGRAGSA